MRNHTNFSDYLERREREAGQPDRARANAAIHGEDAGVVRDPVAERSLYPLLGAVNPARPVSPMNSKPLAMPGRRKLKGQVMGR